MLKGIEDARSRGKKPEELQVLIKELVAKHLVVQGDRVASSWRDQVHASRSPTVFEPCSPDV